jgi:probable phosphomutase (TIGR03848 family)
VTTVLLIRHGRTAANGSGILAGWTPGVTLDDKGREQAQALSQRMGSVPLTAVVSSPLERCQETAAAILDGRDAIALHTDDRVGEAKYGDWTGKPLKTLTKDPLWKIVQQHPSAVQFPGGESLRDMQARAVDAVREWNTKLGDHAIYAIVSHGDVIKSVVADALGAHLDEFQRIVIDPCSVSIVTYTTTRPFVLRVNDSGGDLSFLKPPKKRRSRKASSDAVVGGGAGDGK